MRIKENRKEEISMNLFNGLLGDNHSEELERLLLDQLFDAISDVELESDVLSEKDFYPPEDNRVLQSRLYGIDNTNNFKQYAKEFFELCDEEELY